MADLDGNLQYLQDMRKRLIEMGSVYRELNNFFSDGAACLAREKDIKKLQSFATWLGHELEKKILSENRAQSSWKQAEPIGRWGELFGKVIGFTPGEHPRVEVFKKTLAARQAGRQYSFGTIMICVCKGGLPDGVHILAISELARITNQSEFEIIRKFQQRGDWLFPPAVFLRMLDMFIEKLREGKLRLPILPEQLPAKLAIPRKVTVEFLLPFKAVPRLPPGGAPGTKK